MREIKKSLTQDNKSLRPNLELIDDKYEKNNGSGNANRFNDRHLPLHDFSRERHTVNVKEKGSKKMSNAEMFDPSSSKKLILNNVDNDDELVNKSISIK